jgi:hypothetical protein
MLKRETRIRSTHPVIFIFLIIYFILVVIFGFQSSDPSSTPGMGSRTFSGLALNERSRRLCKGAESHSYAENMDLVVIHDGTHAAKGGDYLFGNP